MPLNWMATTSPTQSSGEDEEFMGDVAFPGWDSCRPGKLVDPKENMSNIDFPDKASNSRKRKQPHLIIFPSIRVKNLTNGQVEITKKFLEGILEFIKFWPGSICVYVQEDNRNSDNLDNVVVSLESLEFELRVIPRPDLGDMTNLLRDSSIVLASLDDFTQNKISQICKKESVPCVYILEYSMKTRIQIARATIRNPVRLIRNYFWILRQEFLRRRAARLANELQCNGTPTFDEYRWKKPHSLLYFDSRVTASMIATGEEVSWRSSSMLQGKPLRILFSGRLARIKGADHLIAVADALRSKGIPFQMFICGGGELEKSMHASIHQQGLTDCVTMTGVLDFETELMPFVKKNADLFVCCHRQGDPSCTYLETMACGVPILSYANEAMVGLNKWFGLGWTVKMNDPKRLADKIAEFHLDRPSIYEMALKSLAFAHQHRFELTFQNRANQLLKLLTKSKQSEMS